MKPRSGEVWLADLGLAAKVRPVIIISADDPNPPRALFIYIPLTTQDRGSRYEVPLGASDMACQSVGCECARNRFIARCPF